MIFYIMNKVEFKEYIRKRGKKIEFRSIATDVLEENVIVVDDVNEVKEYIIKKLNLSEDENYNIKKSGDNFIFEWKTTAQEVITEYPVKVKNFKLTEQIIFRLF